jgi:histidinol-phosphate phosphatase family protein
VPARAGRRAALLDRDGTLMRDHGYVGRADAVELLPGVGAGLRALRDAGYVLAVVTNQSGVHRGLFTMADVDAVNARMSGLLACEGVELASIHVCPHGPEDRCACRKPRPGLAERAAEDLGLDLRRAIVIGDKESDVELGLAIGARTILLAAGRSGSRADLVVPGWADLAALLPGWLQDGTMAGAGSA